mgnify:CR=1 FL=1
MMNDNIKGENNKMKINERFDNHLVVETSRENWETLKSLIQKIDEQDMQLLYLVKHTVNHYDHIIEFETFYLSENINPLNIYIAARIDESENLVDIYILEETFSMLDSLINPQDIDDPYIATDEEIDLIHNLAQAWTNRDIIQDK